MAVGGTLQDMSATLPSLHRTTVTDDPPNEQTPLQAISASPTPLDLFYVRSNNRPPTTTDAPWEITIGGAVTDPVTVTLEDLEKLPTTTVTAVLECAGNGRTLMEPVPDGTPWDLGGASVGEFTGARLSDVLRRVTPDADVVQWVFTGADVGVQPDGEETGYAFPLDHAAAMGGDALLVWELNGQPLPRLNGGPVRLFVPGSYGMHAVKWVRTITAATEPFTGYYRQKYRYFSDTNQPEGSPVGPIAIRSLITSPADGAQVAAGTPLEVCGVAWSNGAAITQVEVDTGDGWQHADLGAAADRYAPTPWTLTWRPTGVGRVTLRSRATDAAGRTQPTAPIWNANGYANNVTHPVIIDVSDG